MKKIIRLTESDLTNLVKKIINSVELIDEARKWVEPSIKEQIENFVNKYKGREDRIFVSYRSSDEYVSFINPKNAFNTPTAIYTYPWKDYFDELFNNVKNNPTIDYRKIVPFTGNKTSNFIYLYKVKDSAFLIDNNTTYEEIKPYAEKLKNIFGEDPLLLAYLKSETDYTSKSNNPYLQGQLCTVCHGNTEIDVDCDKCDGEGKIDCEECGGYGGDEYGNECNLCYGNQKIECDKCYGDGIIIDDCYQCNGTGYRLKVDSMPAHIFWVLIYDLITKRKTKGQIQSKFTNICTDIGVDGFVDLGAGYIHPNELHQAALFKGRTIMEDYVAIPLKTDNQTINLSNSLINGGYLELIKLISLKDDELSKIARYLQQKNLLNNFIENIISNFDNITENELYKLPNKVFYDIPQNVNSFSDRKKYVKDYIINILTKLVNSLPERERIRFENKS